MSNTPGMMGQVMHVGLGDEMINWDAGEMEGDQDLEGTFTMPDGVGLFIVHRLLKLTPVHPYHVSCSKTNVYGF